MGRSTVFLRHTGWIQLFLVYASQHLPLFFIKAFPYAQKILDERTRHGKFLKFFAAVTTETRGAILLFSQKEPSKGAIVRSRPEQKEIIPFDIQAEAEGISYWIPSQDLRGANYVAGELAKIVKKTAFYRTDVDMETDQLDQIRATVFSFGLGFNEFTYRIITAINSKLFRVDISESARTSFQPLTDNINIVGYGVLQPDADTDCAILARIVHPSPNGSPKRYFFVCAGQTATGTAVAGSYLANN